MIQTMHRAWISVPAVLLFVATLAPSQEGLESAVAQHDHHPGLGHPEEGEGHHTHGDADDHHETPDSPCHHQDEHTCCNPGQVLALPSLMSAGDSPAGGFVRLPSLEPRLLPSVRELFHVPLA